MEAIWSYLLKVIVCNALLYGYYLLALRNKSCHHFNRFYLLGTAVVSWIIPLIKWHISQEMISNVKIVQLLTVGESDGLSMHTEKNVITSYVDYSTGVISIYTIVTTIFLIRFLYFLIQISLMIQRGAREDRGSIVLINDGAQRSTFSFFRYIFWDRAVDKESPEGKTMIAHETIHITEKHSVDKLLLNGMLVFGWFNPFLWLTLAEVNVIHEFAADAKTIHAGDSRTLAMMLLKTSYKTTYGVFTQAFYQSPIKRRIQMITKTNVTGTRIRRLMVLPLALVLVSLFAFRLQKKALQTYSRLKQQHIVIIDAGHGGQDDGAKLGNTTEKEINLKIAQLIAASNSDANIKIFLTRNADESIPLPDRVALAGSQKADLFVSVHLNPGPPKSGAQNTEVYVARNPGKHSEASNLYGSYLINDLKPVINKKIEIVKRSQNIYVLDHNPESPSVLLSLGVNLNDESDPVIHSVAYQNHLAQAIANSIHHYFERQERK